MFQRVHVYIIVLLESKIYWNYILLIPKLCKSVRNCVNLFFVGLFTKLFFLCPPRRGGKELNQSHGFFVFRFIAQSPIEMAKFQVAYLHYKPYLFQALKKTFKITVSFVYTFILKLYIENIFKIAVKLSDRLTSIFPRRVRMKNTTPQSRMSPAIRYDQNQIMSRAVAKRGSQTAKITKEMETNESHIYLGRQIEITFYIFG